MIRLTSPAAFSVTLLGIVYPLLLASLVRIPFGPLHHIEKSGAHNTDKAGQSLAHFPKLSPRRRPVELIIVALVDNPEPSRPSRAWPLCGICRAPSERRACRARL